MKKKLFIGALLCVAFGLGYGVGKYQIFPYKVIHKLVSKIGASPARSESDPRFLRASMLAGVSAKPGQVVSRTAILNTLIERFGYRSYLEIGQGQKRDNFDFINCAKKVGVDPEKSLGADYPVTSDEFFAANHDTFDLIFIDGLHVSGQVEKDIDNALKVLNENGTIVIHDCNPTQEIFQLVPPNPKIHGPWNGDVWKAWVKMRGTRPDLKMYVVNENTGCGIIRRGRQDLIPLPEYLCYEYLEKNRVKALNLVDVAYFLEDIK